MARANQDVGEQAKSLANLAWVHNRLGFIAQAADEYEALLPLIETRAPADAVRRRVSTTTASA